MILVAFLLTFPPSQTVQMSRSLAMHSGPEYARWLSTYARKLAADGDKVGLSRQEILAMVI